MSQKSIMPGQRFRQFDGLEQDQVVTVSRLDRDQMGLRQVIFATPAGREICAYATQIEAAIAAGELFPADESSDLAVYAIGPAEKLAS
jgi:hypothetical protein